MLAKIIKYDHLGRGITNDDKVTFIPKTMIDEDIEYNIIKENKKYNEGVLVNIINKNKNRVESLCPYYNECNGCHLRHMSYKDTIKFKEDKLKDIFNKYLNISYDIKVIPSKDNYRNKITLKIVNGIIGYYKENTHDVIEINSCLNVLPIINKFIPSIKLFNIINGEIIIRANYKDELLISINTINKVNIPKLNFNIIGIIVNNKVIKGDSYFIDNINKLDFKVSYNSFFQVNSYINKELFKILNKYINKNSIILDLYSGVGTLGLSVQKLAKKVICIDNNKDNIVDALENSKINSADNVYFILNDALTSIPKIKDNIDTVIIDPPRHGLDKKGLNNLLNINANKIIYISCDPMTLVRDLKLLNEQYKIEYITGLDMFPYTYHIETLTILTKRTVKNN